MATNVWQMVTQTVDAQGIFSAEFVIPGLFGSREIAYRAAEGRGPYGDPARVREVGVFHSFGEFLGWEKSEDPEYQEFLRLRAKFGEAF